MRLLTLNYFVTDYIFIANQFNKFFTSIASKLIQKFSISTEIIDPFLGTNNENTFFMSPTSNDEVVTTKYLKISNKNFQNH